MNDMEKGTEETAKDDHGHEKQPPPPPPDEDDTLSSYKLSLFATVTLIIVIGAMVAAAFMGLGITAEHQDVQSQFDASATDLVQKIQTAWESYVTAASMMHNFCRHRNFTRAEFRGLYEYMIDTGLNFQAAQFDPNITDDERDDAEAEARAYYAQYYPHIHYQGFTGFNWENSTQVEPRNRAPFYFPIHYMEPIIGNEPAIDLDYYASGSRQRTVTFCMEHGKPALTDRLRLVQETAKASYGVVLFHPGVNVTSSNETWPRDLASIVIRIPDLLLRSAENQHQASIIYLYDKSDSHGIPLFLGAAQVEPPLGPRRKSSATLTPLPEIPLQEAMTGTYRTYNINAANKIWIVIVQRADGTFDPHPVFVILGGVIIFVATVCLAIWVYSNTIRMKNFQEERAKAKAEKAAFILESAQLAAHRERELNDFIAHEVRNPVAAAMAACSFVKAAIHKDPPFPTYESLETAREDIGTIDNALLFVNDLLRDMLDMHRATNHQLIIKLTPTDILHDVLEPVDGMLYQREGHMRVSVECPKNLVVMSDRLRLKQVILNLGRNSAKFVGDGFLKLRARVDDNGMVQLRVEDSGPGIPVHKRSQLFNKYQESLDMLNQGTVRTHANLSLCGPIQNVLMYHIFFLFQ
jgi:signal transduction histidine kinase/CHASE1-domain containing sensor protein